MATAPPWGLLVLITAKHAIFACGNRVTSHGRGERAQLAADHQSERGRRILLRDWQRRFDAGLCNALGTVVISRLLQIAESFDVDVIESHRTYRRAARCQPCFESGSPLVVGDLARDRRGSPAMGRQCRARARALAVVKALASDARLGAFRVLPLSGAQLIDTDGRLTR